MFKTGNIHDFFRVSGWLGKCETSITHEFCAEWERPKWAVSTITVLILGGLGAYKMATILVVAPTDWKRMKWAISTISVSVSGGLGTCETGNTHV